MAGELQTMFDGFGGGSRARRSWPFLRNACRADKQSTPPFPHNPFYGKLLAMGNKDKGKKETKKAPKPKPKPEPSRREVFTPQPPPK